MKSETPGILISLDRQLLSSTTAKWDGKTADSRSSQFVAEMEWKLPTRLTCYGFAVAIHKLTEEEQWKNDNFIDALRIKEIIIISFLGLSGDIFFNKDMFLSFYHFLIITSSPFTFFAVFLLTSI